MYFQSLLKRFLPRSIRNALHFFYAWWGAVKYRHPSEELLVIGVTGTSGKSSTIYFLRQVLESAGFRVGALSTLEFCVAGECRLNDQKMTMLGRTGIQRYLRQMADAGCDIALIETTSEGAVQHRHRFINYDVIALTNLYPEHIESHGSFDKYKKAKLGIFHAIARTRRKILDGKTIEKTVIVNGDVKASAEFLAPPFDRRVRFSASDIAHMSHTREGLLFDAYEKEYETNVHGEYNAMNLLVVIHLARAASLRDDEIKSGIEKLLPVPGRIEFIPEARANGFEVIVDYAFEPVAMKELYKVVNLFSPKRVIHVFGSTGGGRDVSRRFTVGEFVGRHADICIITDEDPYDDDPMAIIRDVAGAARAAGKRDNETLFIISDRGAAIKHAAAMARTGDVVLITGKGSEQAMVVKSELVPWDDRQKVRESLTRLR